MLSLTWKARIETRSESENDAQPRAKPACLKACGSTRAVPFAGATKGERVSKRKGISIEFADFRNYSDGDDLRHLDWNVLARLESPVLRTYQDEEDLVVYLVVDNSASMNFGEPEKSGVATKLAAALGTVALISGDAVRLTSGSQSAPPAQALRGRANVPKPFCTSRHPRARRQKCWPGHPVATERLRKVRLGHSCIRWSG